MRGPWTASAHGPKRETILLAALVLATCAVGLMACQRPGAVDWPLAGQGHGGLDDRRVRVWLDGLRDREVETVLRRVEADMRSESPHPRGGEIWLDVQVWQGRLATAAHDAPPEVREALGPTLDLAARLAREHPASVLEDFPIRSEATREALRGRPRAWLWLAAAAVDEHRPALAIEAAHRAWAEGAGIESLTLVSTLLLRTPSLADDVERLLAADAELASSAWSGVVEAQMQLFAAQTADPKADASAMHEAVVRAHSTLLDTVSAWAADVDDPAALELVLHVALAGPKTDLVTARALDALEQIERDWPLVLQPMERTIAWLALGDARRARAAAAWLAPNSEIDIELRIGLARFALGDTAGARESAATLLEMDRYDPLARWFAGRTAIIDDQFATALADIGYALERTEHAPSQRTRFLGNLDNELLMVGLMIELDLIESARRYLEQAGHRFPDRSPRWWELAVWLAPDAEARRAMLRDAQARFPEAATLSRLVARLEAGESDITSERPRPHARRVEPPTPLRRVDVSDAATVDARAQAVRLVVQAGSPWMGQNRDAVITTDDDLLLTPRHTWDLGSGRLVAEFETWVTDMRTTSDESRLIATHRSAKVDVAHPVTREPYYRIEGFDVPVHRVAIGPDDRYVAFAGADASDEFAVWLWDLQEDVVVAETRLTDPGTSWGPVSIELTRRAVLVTTDRRNWVLNPRTLERRLVFDHGFAEISDGHLLMVNAGFASVWDLDDGRLLSVLDRCAPGVDGSLDTEHRRYACVTDAGIELRPLGPPAPAAGVVLQRDTPLEGEGSAWLEFADDGDRLLVVSGAWRDEAPSVELWETVDRVGLTRRWGASDGLRDFSTPRLVGEDLMIRVAGKSSLEIDLPDITFLTDAAGRIQSLADIAAVVTGSSPVRARRHTDALAIYDIEDASRRALVEWGTVQPASLAMAPDGRAVIAAGHESSGVQWDLEGAALERLLPDMVAVTWIGDGRRFAGLTGEGELRVHDGATGEVIQRFALGEANGPLLAAPNDQLLVGRGGLSWEPTSLVQLDLESGAIVRAWQPDGDAEHFKRIAVDGEGHAFAADDNGLERLELDSGTRVRTRVAANVDLVAAHASSRTLAITMGPSDAREIVVYDITHDALEERWRRSAESVSALAFGARGERVVLAVLAGDEVVLRDAATGELSASLPGVAADWHTIAMSADGHYLLSATTGGIAIHDIEAGEEACRLYAFENDTWAVVDTLGRYDAAAGGDIDGLHWVVGSEAIGLAQLKERFYDPGLLAKHLGESESPLRDVRRFAEVDLYPSVALEAADEATTELRVGLRNRGGGLGRVQVWVNGKEIHADARGATFDPDADEASLRIDVADHPALRPGEENEVRVRVFNEDGYLASRGHSVRFVAPGQRRQSPPELHAVVVGVSDYAGTALDLRFAAADAVDFAAALELAAARLFGDAHVHVHLLSTSERETTEGTTPTKAAIREAFSSLESISPHDVVVVYFAGHGVEVAGSEDSYAFLTADARTAELEDDAIMERVAITNEELAGWLKRIPALKQVLILDTCAAEALLGPAEQRSRASDQIRAIERLKDRTGTFILMGSAADAVSYEATRFGQGLLTYALLEGMKGAALREGAFVDVGQLFGYAADVVPRLAYDIGGRQQPVISAPRGSSFDIGQLEPGERDAIDLAQPVPIVSRPIVLNPDEIADPLRLTAALTRSLQRTSARTDGARRLVFVDVGVLPGAIEPRGVYRLTDEGKLRAELRLWLDDEPVASIEAEADAGDVDALSQRLVEEIASSVASLASREGEPTQ